MQGWGCRVQPVCAVEAKLVCARTKCVAHCFCAECIHSGFSRCHHNPHVLHTNIQDQSSSRRRLSPCKNGIGACNELITRPAAIQCKAAAVSAAGCQQGFLDDVVDDVVCCFLGQPELPKCLRHRNPATAASKAHGWRTLRSETI